MMMWISCDLDAEESYKGQSESIEVLTGWKDELTSDI